MLELVLTSLGTEQNSAKVPSYLTCKPCKPFAISTQSHLTPQSCYYSKNSLPYLL